MMKKVLLLLCFLAATIPPLLQGQITETHAFTTTRVVPDGNASGLQDVRNISSAIAQISRVQVRLKINSDFMGDLYAYVRHSSGFCVLLNRPGKTASNAAGTDDSGLDVTFATGAVNGDVHVYRNVTTPPPGSPLTGTWEPDARNADPAVVTDAAPRGASLASFNGLSAAGEWTLFLADLEAGGTNQLREWALEIQGAVRPALAWSNPADILYGTKLGPSQLNATVLHNSTTVSGTLTFTPALNTLLNAGLAQTLSATFTPADAGTFLPVSTNVTLNVLRAPLTITADNQVKAYGEALPALTASYSGFVNNETPVNLDTPVTLAHTASPSSAAGTYPITASGAVDANYTITHIPGSLTITQSLTLGAITSSANPARPGASVSFTMAVTARAPGAGNPTGPVNFRINGGIAGSAALSGGVATFTLNTLALGLHAVTAEYAGDGNFVGGTNTLAPAQVINTPPVAGTDVIERYPTQNVRVRLSTLLANDSDADGDTLVINVSATSAHGGAITLAGDWVTYTPAPGFNATDSFTYTITDGRGGAATGIVTVNIKVDSDPGQNLTIVDLGGGSFRIRGSGIPGRTYRLQYSDTTAPVNWQPLPGASVTADASGVFDFVDTSGSASRLYRSVYP